MPSTSSESSLRTQILQAGAGAGKTTTLISSFFSVFQEKPDARVMVTTFSRKATQELKERILAKAILEKKSIDTLMNPKNVQISTMHGILFRLLQQSFKEWGGVQELTIASAVQVSDIRRKILFQILKSNTEFQELFENYSAADLIYFCTQYVDHSIRIPDLTSAQDADLFACCVRPLEKLSIQAQFLLQEFPAALAEKDNGVVLLSFLKCFPDQWSLGNYASLYKNLSQHSYWDFSKIRKSKALADNWVTAYADFHSEAKDVFCDQGSVFSPLHWEVMVKNSVQVQKLAELYKLKWLQQLQQSGIFAVSDLELMSIALLRDHPEVALQFQAQWDFWMVDEYQDTSPIQLQILKNLIGETPCFYVGDPQQSIYYFRGARSEIFFETQEALDAAGFKVNKSSRNHRSEPQVLAAINQIFSIGNDFEEMIASKVQSLDEPAVNLNILDEKSNFMPQVVLNSVQELVKKNIPLQDIAILCRNNESVQQIARILSAHQIPTEIPSGGNFEEKREILDSLFFLRFLALPEDDLNLWSLLRSPWFYIPSNQLLEIKQKTLLKKSLWSVCLEETVEKEHPFYRLKNYLLLLDQSGFVESFRIFLKDSGMIDAALKLDPTGQAEGRLWRLLRELKSQSRQSKFQILEFIDEYLQFNPKFQISEQEEVSSHLSPNRVKVMTIHASKGLQFSEVLIPWLEKRSVAELKSKWSFDSEKRIFCVHTIDENGASLYSPLAEKNRQERSVEVSKESERVFYVACSRAIRALHFFWIKPEKYWAEKFIGWDLQEGVHANNNEQFAFQYKVQTWSEEKLALLDFTSTQTKEKTSVRTAFQIYAEIPVAVAEKKLSVQDFKAVWHPVRRGLEVHQALETGQGTSDRILEKFGIASQLDSESSFRSIFETGQREWGYSIVASGKVLRRRIDLWGKFKDEVWIFDYKTGARLDSIKAFEQLGEYALHLNQMKLIETSTPVHLCIVRLSDRAEFQTQIWQRDPSC